jgi:lipid-binding SYLF domain-containing protein
MFLRPIARLLILLFTAALAHADTAEEIDADVDVRITELVMRAPQLAGLIDRASGVLVFPDLVRMGFGEGGVYGEGALRVRGETVAYFAVAGSQDVPVASGAKAELILFMTPEALLKLRETRNYTVGQDAELVSMALEPAEHDIPSAVVSIAWDESGALLATGLRGNVIARIAR